MKVFKFDPKTGKRGKLIDNVERTSWGGQSVNFCLRVQSILEPEFMPVMPRDNSSTKWLWRMDAGVEQYGQFIDYARDEWICFCEGQFNGVWEWTVLAPKGFLKANEEPREFKVYRCDENYEWVYQGAVVATSHAEACATFKTPRHWESQFATCIDEDPNN